MKNVSLFIPCLVDSVVPSVGQAAVDLLKKLDVKPTYNKKQTCCGQPAHTAGFRRQAVKMAKHFIEVFEGSETIVCPSGSCVHMVKHHYPELLAEEPDWLRRAEELGGRIFELTEFIVDVLKVEDVGSSFEGKAAYHESCQLHRGLGVNDQPRKLIAASKGTEVVPLQDAGGCCGFGGAFANKHPEISAAMLQAKTENYIASGADIMIVGEPGCLINISGYFSRNHPDKKVVHIAEFLAGRTGV